MSNAIVSNSIRASRVELAKQLTANVAAKAKPEVDAEKARQLEELKAVTMTNPFTGKPVKALYFGEIFPARGITLADYLEAQYVERAEYDRVVAELDSLKSKKAPPALKA